MARKNQRQDNCRSIDNMISIDLDGKPAWVECFWIIASKEVCFRAWEEQADHSTIAHRSGVNLGDIRTRRSHCDLPVGDERSAAVKAHYDEAAADSAKAIMIAFPDLADDPNTVIRDGEAWKVFGTIEQAKSYAKQFWCDEWVKMDARIAAEVARRLEEGSTF